MTVNKSKSVQLVSALSLLFATVIWGSSFVTQTDSAKHIETFTLLSYRSYIASFALGAIIFIRYLIRKKRGNTEDNNGKNGFLRMTGAGVFCGVMFTLAAALQQMGIYYNTMILGIDTAGRAAFVTAMYIIFVPMVAMMFGKKCGASIWAGAVLCLGGMYFLCASGDGGFALGDIMLVGCAVAFTGQILVIDLVCYKYDSLWICFYQFFTAAIISTPIALMFENISISGLYSAFPSMLYLGIIGSAVAYTIQIVAQKNLHPAIASLIMSFESVFATLSGALFLDEKMTLIQGLSCIAIFIGILVAQFGGYLKELFTRKLFKKVK